MKMIPQQKRRYDRTLEDTLEAWKALERLNTPLTKKQRKQREEYKAKYLNDDGTLKQEPTEDELREYDEMQEELAMIKPIRINRADIDNFDKGIITKKRIKQLENFIRFRSQPKS